jgi:hypothetical protein
MLNYSTYIYYVVTSLSICLSYTSLSVYADDVNILGGSVHTIKENSEALLVASKEIGLEVNADKTKYMVISRDQTAGRSHSMKIDNSSFVRVGEFKYLGTTLTNQNSIQEEIKSRLKSGIPLPCDIAS